MSAGKAWRAIGAAVLTATFVTAVQAVFAFSGTACGDATTTSIVIGVSTQARVPKDLTSVTVLVEPLGGATAPTCTVLALDGTRTLTVRATGAAGNEARVTVSGFAEAGPPGGCTTTLTPKVVRAAHVRFVDGQSLYLPMALRHACFGVACDGASDQTCAAGQCVSVESATPAPLVAYDDSLTSGDSSFCMTKTLCFDDRVPGLLLDEQTCDYRMTVDVTSAKGVNMELVHEDLTREVLDVDDPLEGYTLDPDRPERFRLAPGLCARIRNHQVAAVSVGVGCPSKRVLNPMCAGVAGIGSPDAGLPEAPELCTSGADVVPAASAIYFLADRSSAMRAYFGGAPVDPNDPQSVPFTETLDLTLRSPSLRNTKIALRTLPGAASDCATGGVDFASPEIPFRPATDAHGSIAAVFADASRVLATNPPLFVDAALQPNGAYGAFATVGGGGGGGGATSLGLAEVLLLFDRDPWTNCAASTVDPPILAYNAFHDQGIHTGALFLHPPEGVDNGIRDPYVDGTWIARSQGGFFFDASPAAAVDTVAFARLATEVGSCLYDLPSSIDASRADLPSTKLSWFDYIHSVRVDVPYAPGCSATTNADGWSLDPGGRRARICGVPCNDLRDVLHFASIYALAQHVPPPDVKVVWAPPCGP